VTRLGLARALSSPEYHPLGLDLERHTISFVRLSAEARRDAAFLVPRMAAMGPRQHTFNLDDLLPEPSARPSGSGPHFILISAFCCSTLLARCLDEVPGCVVLREPALPAQLAFAKFGAAAAGCGQPRADWTQTLRLSLELLRRGGEAGGVVVVKASDVPNCISADLMAAAPASRFVLLAVALRTFILSVLKSPPRRRWMRARVRFWRRALAGREAELGALAEIDPRRLDDARMSAYHWLVTRAYWRAFDAAEAAGRALAVDGEEVPQDPAAVSARVAEFFGVRVTSEVWSRIASAPALSRHAKEKGRTYGAERRKADVEAWDAKYGREANTAVMWAAPLGRALGIGAGAWAGRNS
jgi:hypothetical protein